MLCRDDERLGLLRGVYRHLLGAFSVLFRAFSLDETNGNRAVVSWPFLGRDDISLEGNGGIRLGQPVSAITVGRYANRSCTSLSRISAAFEWVQRILSTSSKSFCDDIGTLFRRQSVTPITVVGGP